MPEYTKTETKGRSRTDKLLIFSGYLTVVIIMIFGGSMLFKGMPITTNDNWEKVVEVDHKGPSAETHKMLRTELKTLKVDTNYMYHMNGFAYPASSNNELTLLCGGKAMQDIRNYFDTINPRKLPTSLVNANTPGMIEIKRAKKKTITNTNINGDVSLCLEDSMMVNESYKALLVISRKMVKGEIQSLLDRSYPEGLPRVTIDTMKLAKKMFASLRPAMSDQFAIVRADLDTVKQIDLESKDFITWEWIITPLKTGISNLVLTISRTGTGPTDPNDFIPAKIIAVKVSAVKRTAFEKAKDFVLDEWKFLVSGLFALIGWVLVFKKKKDG